MNRIVDGLYDTRNSGGYLIMKGDSTTSRTLNSLFVADAKMVDNDGGYGEALIRDQNGNLLLVPESSGKVLRSGKVRYTFWAISEKLANEIGFRPEETPPTKLEGSRLQRGRNRDVIVDGIGGQYKEVMETMERRRGVS